MVDGRTLKDAALPLRRRRSVPLRFLNRGARLRRIGYGLLPVSVLREGRGPLPSAGIEPAQELVGIYVARIGRDGDAHTARCFVRSPVSRGQIAEPHVDVGRPWPDCFSDFISLPRAWPIAGMEPCRSQVGIERRYPVLD